MKINETLEKNQVKLGAVLSYISIAVNILAGLIYTPWMIKQIGDSSYGLFTLANTLITLFMVDFGLSSAAARYVSKYRAEGNTGKVNAFLGMIYKLYFIVDAVIFIALTVVFFFIEDIYVKLTPEEIEKFKVVYVIAGSYSLISFPFVTMNGIMTAYEKFIQLKLADLMYRLLMIGMMVAALLLGFGLYSLVTVNAIAGIISIIYKLSVVKTKTPIKVNFKYFDKELLKDIFGFSLWVTINSLAQRLIFSITPSVLGMVADSVAIAVFGVIATIEGYSYNITSAINGMFMPKIARIYSGTDSDTDIMPLMMKVGRFQYALNGLIIAGFAVVGKQFIEVWMDETYSLAYTGILLVIIPGLFFNSLQIANTAMIVKKKVNIQAYIAVGTGLVNIVCSYFMSRAWGVLGSCISIFIAYMLRDIAFNVVYYKYMKFDIPQFAKKCYLGMLPPILITIILGMGMNRLIYISGWAGVAIKGLITAAIYLALVYFTGLTGEERKKVTETLKSKLRRK